MTVSLFSDSSSCGCVAAGATQAYVEEVELQFDWQQSSNQSYVAKVGENLTVGSTTAYVIRISIPANASVGLHPYAIFYVGQHNDSHRLATGSFYVHDASERVYNGLLSTVQMRLEAAANATFRSQDARSLVDQARTTLSKARNFANSSDFEGAVTQLKVASSLIDQAYSSDQNYQTRTQTRQESQPRQASQNPMLLGGIAAAVAGIASLGVFLKIRKSTQSNG